MSRHVDPRGLTTYLEALYVRAAVGKEAALKYVTARSRR